MPNEVRNVLNANNIAGLICAKLLVSTGPPGTSTPSKTTDRSKSADTVYLFLIFMDTCRIEMMHDANPGGMRWCVR